MVGASISSKVQEIAHMSSQVKTLPKLGQVFSTFLVKYVIVLAQLSALPIFRICITYLYLVTIHP